MENIRTDSGSGLAVWAASFSAAAEQKQGSTRDQHQPTHSQHHSGHSRQQSQGRSSQSRSYHPPSQLTFSTPTDNRTAAPTPHFLSSSAGGETTQLPPSFVAAIHSGSPTGPTPPSQQRTARTNIYTVSSTATAASLADLRVPRAAEEMRADGHLAHNYSCGSGSAPGHTARPGATSSIAASLPHPNKIPPAAVAAAAAVMHPVYASHSHNTEEAGAKMEACVERLEDYLDLQDDDDGDSTFVNGAVGTVGDTNHDVAFQGYLSSSNAGRSSSQHSQPSRSNGRSAHWMNELYEMTGEVGAAGVATVSNTAVTGVSAPERREAAESKGLRGRSPCTPLATEVQPVLSSNSTNNHSRATSAGSAHAAHTQTPLEPLTAYLSKVQPPPLSGFTPVAAVASGSTPLDYKASSANAEAPHEHSFHQTSLNHVGDGPGVRRRNSATPQPLSLASSLKVSPASRPSPVDVMDEERRLREELRLLRQRVADTEQRLAMAQRRIALEGCTPPLNADLSMNAGRPTPQLIVSSASEARLMESPPSHLSTMAPAFAGPRYTAGVPPVDVQQQQQQQHQHQHFQQQQHPHHQEQALQELVPPHLRSSSTGSKMYASSAPPSASATMTRSASSEPSARAGSGVTYFVQNGGPYGVYAVPSPSTLVDAAGQPIHAASAMQARYAAAGPTNGTPQAGSPTAHSSAGSAVQVLVAQPYVVNNQPTICYMVMAPQQQQQHQQLQQQQQPQQPAAPGVFSAPMQLPEFGSVNGNGPGLQMNGRAVAHMPALTATAGKLPDVLPSAAHLVMVGPASNGELTRKCFNVHGSMMGVVQYYPYDEQAPPAPTATILTAAASPSASTLNQSMSGTGWSTRSINGGVAGGSLLHTGADVGLGGSCRSHDGFVANDSGFVTSPTGGVSVPQAGGGSNSPNSTSPPSTPADLSTAPVLPIFIQMFPCELHDRATVLNRLMESTCGRDFGVVQRIEPRSETSFIAHVRTHQVWQLIYRLRCRVLMDRFGFWYAADLDQYVRMKEYCEGVRRLPQQTRHFQTDGLPCMPLVVELSRAVDKALVTENNAPRTFDELIPIAAVDRHRTRMHTAAATAGVTGSGPQMVAMHNGVSGGGGAVVGFSTVTPASQMPGDHSSFASQMSVGPLQRGSVVVATASETGYMPGVASLNGSARVGQAPYMDTRPPPPPFHMQ